MAKRTLDVSNSNGTPAVARKPRRPLREPSEEVARQTLARANARKVEQCSKELAAVLEKHGCRLSTRQEVIDGQPSQNVEIRIVPR